MHTPVALIIFNRPEKTEEVMRQIAKARPRKLLLIADGPRSTHPEDQVKCAATREVVERMVDWDCELIREYAAENLGCGRRPATGITRLFQHVSEAIILEDDCIPHPTFFRYCEELLERYRDDERVMHIAGSTYRACVPAIPYSYRFSCFNGAWGWATWRRAWRHFDLELKNWPLLRDTSWLMDIMEDEVGKKSWAHEFERAWDRRGDVSYWDHQWTFACWANSGLSIVPHQNLVSNIGCGKDATHTLSEQFPTAKIPTVEMQFPLKHPPFVLQDRDRDREYFRNVILPQLNTPETLIRRIRRLGSRMTPEAVKKALRPARFIAPSQA